jgi:hypothetical protein
MLDRHLFGNETLDSLADFVMKKPGDSVRKHHLRLVNRIWPAIAPLRKRAVNLLPKDEAEALDIFYSTAPGHSDPYEAVADFLRLPVSRIAEVYVLVRGAWASFKIALEYYELAESSRGREIILKHIDRDNQACQILAAHITGSRPTIEKLSASHGLPPEQTKLAILSAMSFIKRQRKSQQTT